MRRTDLEFVAPRFRAWLPGALLLLSAAAVCGYLIDQYLERNAQLVRWEQRSRRLENGRKPKAAEQMPATHAEREKLDAEVNYANQVIGRLAAPWDALFKGIDASVDDRVVLLSVEPDAERREVKILAEAKDLGAMLDYVRRLQAVALFRDVHVIHHQIQQQDAQRPVRFVVVAGWLAAGKQGAQATTPQF